MARGRDATVPRPAVPAVVPVARLSLECRLCFECLLWRLCLLCFEWWLRLLWWLCFDRRECPPVLCASSPPPAAMGDGGAGATSGVASNAAADRPLRDVRELATE